MSAGGEDVKIQMGEESSHEICGNTTPFFGASAEILSDIEDIPDALVEREDAKQTVPSSDIPATTAKEFLLCEEEPIPDSFAKETSEELESSLNIAEASLLETPFGSIGTSLECSAAKTVESNTETVAGKGAFSAYKEALDIGGVDAWDHIANAMHHRAMELPEFTASAATGSPSSKMSVSADRCVFESIPSPSHASVRACDAMVDSAGKTLFENSPKSSNADTRNIDPMPTVETNRPRFFESMPKNSTEEAPATRAAVGKSAFGFINEQAETSKSGEEAYPYASESSAETSRDGPQVQSHPGSEGEESTIESQSMLESAVTDRIVRMASDAVSEPARKKSGGPRKVFSAYIADERSASGEWFVVKKNERGRRVSEVSPRPRAE